MRVLLSTYGSRGDVEPMAGFAARLRELGADVRLCAPPDEEFATVLDCAGVPLVPVGWSARELTKAAPPPSSLPAYAKALIAKQFELIPAAAKGCDVVVATGMFPALAGALSVAEMLTIRSVTVSFQKIGLPSPHHPPMAYPGRPFPPEITDNGELWEYDAESIDVLFGDALNSNRVANGLPAVDHVRDHTLGGHLWLATDPLLDPWERTAGLDVVQTGSWTLPDDRPLPVEVIDFLDAGTPPVFIGFGSMPMHAAVDVAAVAIEAVRALGRRVIVRRGWAELARIDDRDDVLLVDEVNQQALFRRVAAVVHHGGAGTTLTATGAGAAQVVVPQATDQPYWAGRVAELGSGVAHDGPVPTVESLTAALEVALAPETRARAIAVGGRIRTDGTTVAAKFLQELFDAKR